MELNAGKPGTPWNGGEKHKNLINQRPVFTCPLGLISIAGGGGGAATRAHTVISSYSLGKTIKNELSKSKPPPS